MTENQEERLVDALESIAASLCPTGTGKYGDITLNEVGKELVQQLLDINNGLNRIVNGLEQLKIDKIRFTQ
jgi:hypothetical protein